jgi:phosphoenolpyruvate carboxylase
MKIKIVIGLVALAVNGAMASPRTDYLTEKLRESKTIELQAKSKYLAEKGRYNAATRYRSSLESELKDVYKRERRQDEQIRKAYRAEYLRVGNINTEDMTAPVSINWRTR